MATLARRPRSSRAARAPPVDFGVNAQGTLNVLECTRQHCPEAVFIFTSTNKVYGDTPNFLPLREDACKVSLTMDFEFAGALIDKAFGAVFHQIANSLVDAFCKQADEVYRG